MNNRGFVNVRLYDKEHADSCIYSSLLRMYLEKNVADALQMLQIVTVYGRLAKLVNAQVLGTCGAILESSSLLSPTNTLKTVIFYSFTFIINTVSAIWILGRRADVEAGA